MTEKTLEVSAKEVKTNNPGEPYKGFLAFTGTGKVSFSKKKKLSNLRIRWTRLVRNARISTSIRHECEFEPHYRRRFEAYLSQ